MTIRRMFVSFVALSALAVVPAYAQTSTTSTTFYPSKFYSFTSTIFGATTSHGWRASGASGNDDCSRLFANDGFSDQPPWRLMALDRLPCERQLQSLIISHRQWLCAE